jgi:outer membrane lipoprotein-sorting protein
MMRRFSVLAVVIIGAFSLVCSQNSKAEKAGSAGQPGKNALSGKIDMGEFSATITKTVAGKTIVGKTFISKDKMRDENTVGDKVGATIIRLDKKVTWILMEKNQYMEISGLGDAEKNSPDPRLIQKEYEQKFEVKSLGNEKVNGYSCEKKQYTDKEGKFGVTTIWYSPKLKYMMKSESMMDGKVIAAMELSDIKEGNIPASLFEVPAGYTLFDPMSQVPPEMRGMMKGMMKGMIPGGMPKNTGSESGE